jgi:hypothetical protein
MEGKGLLVESVVIIAFLIARRSGFWSDLKTNAEKKQVPFYL